MFLKATFIIPGPSMRTFHWQGLPTWYLRKSKSWPQPVRLSSHSLGWLVPQWLTVQQAHQPGRPCSPTAVFVPPCNFPPLETEREFQVQMLRWNPAQVAIMCSALQKKHLCQSLSRKPTYGFNYKSSTGIFLTPPCFSTFFHGLTLHNYVFHWGDLYLC